MTPSAPMRWARAGVAVAVLVGALGLPAAVGRSTVDAATPCPPSFTVTIDVGDPYGTTTACEMDPSTTYLLEASGRFQYGHSQYDLADAECSTHAPQGQLPVLPDATLEQPGWQPHRYAVIGTEFVAPHPLMPLESDLWDPDLTDDYLDLYVDGRSVEWTPNSPVPAHPDYQADDRRFLVGPGCSSDHRYRSLFTPARTRVVEFRVLDLEYTSNSGGPLTVTVTEVGPASGALVDNGYVETVLVHSFDDDPVLTTSTLRSDREYLFVAHGVYHYLENPPTTDFSQGYLADAACSRVHVEKDPTDPEFGEGDDSWRRDRFSGNRLQLLIEGFPVVWRPVAPTDPLTPEPPSTPPGQFANPVNRCDRAQHLYTFTGAGPGSPVSFVVQDVNHEDNRGTLSVDVYELGPAGAPSGPLPPVPPVCVTVGGDDLLCVPS